ncbi:fluoride efflux transporter CrcB [Pacificoceanicola onchidii]|uniref:fluoride efflux transporter CrcB n=1 Tax=Pacificoceanicola onchidii TaxID=2562685 RepID=UPI0010A4BD4B|nr:fluoride efflux transporter CrcB [Pacificoceanicola onchidii]
MVSTVLMVAAGGATGAMARYGVGLFMAQTVAASLPLGVIAVNILGSFVMGAFASFAATRDMLHLSPLVMTGFLGGFTTFSAFSLEAVTLFEKGQINHALLYVALSVLGSIGALILAAIMARMIWA